MDPEMSTENRGQIIDMMRTPSTFKHEYDPIGRGSFEEPAEYVVGPHGSSVGGNDPDNMAERG